MRLLVTALAVFALPLACVSARDKTKEATTPATKPAVKVEKTDKPTTTATSRPTTTAEIDARAKEILDKLEKAGDKYKTLKADIDYTIVMTQFGDTDKRTGRVAFQQKTKNTPAKFSIQFATRQLGKGRQFREKEDYAFDGRWLTIAKYKTREMTRYELCEKGKEIDVLTIGKGPFPIPFGQKAADVIKFCQVTTQPIKKGEPEKTSYIKLVPRKKYKKEMNFTQLEMWVDAKQHLPVKIVSRDRNKDITTVVFKKTETNVKLDKDVFYPPRKSGWQYHEEKLEKSQPAGTTKTKKE